ncbi:MAG: hypothetical protein CL437_07950 [Acidimicrobiaceae bacterium]|nr:hypothetical protein [Acidimicrobiaceae bacterium]
MPTLPAMSDLPANGPSTLPARDWTSEDAWIGTRRPILEAHALPADAYTSEDFAVTHDFWIDVNNEDVDVVQRGQVGLNSGSYTPGRLSPRYEEPLHRFHNMLADRMIGISRIPDGDPGDDAPLLGTGVNPLPWHRYTATT